MADHPIEGLMDTTLEKIRQMVDINSIVGDPITSPDGTVIIPISKISYGFASGGTDIPAKVQSDKEFFGGGTGAGVSINPVAFLTISQGNVKLLRVDPGNTSVDRIIEMVPDLLDRISGALGKKKGEKTETARETSPSPDPEI